MYIRSCTLYNQLKIIWFDLLWHTFPIDPSPSILRTSLQRSKSHNTKTRTTCGGGSRIFSFGGGGTKDYMCAQAHYERKAWSPFRLGSRARLRTLEALGVFFMLPHAIWGRGGGGGVLPYCLSILMQNPVRDKRTRTVIFQSKFRGGGGGVCLLRPPLDHFARPTEGVRPANVHQSLWG